MRRADLPWGANALLSFVASEQPALAGDLVEEYHAGRSRRWLWTQLAGAAMVTAWHRRRARPVVVRLVTVTPYDRPDRTVGLLDPSLINLTGTNVRSVGGLSLLVLIVLMTLVMPQTWWLVAIGLAGGIVVGVVLIRRRRPLGLSGPSGRGPLGLFDAPPVERPADARSVRPGMRVEELVAV